MNSNWELGLYTLVLLSSRVRIHAQDAQNKF